MMLYFNKYFISCQLRDNPSLKDSLKELSFSAVSSEDFSDDFSDDPTDVVSDFFPLAVPPGSLPLERHVKVNIAPG